MPKSSRKPSNAACNIGSGESIGLRGRRKRRPSGKSMPQPDTRASENADAAPAASVTSFLPAVLAPQNAALRVSHLSPEWVPIGVFRIPNRTLKRHSEPQLAMLMSSLTTFGWITPVLATRSGEIVAGHGRILAAKRLGVTQVPTVFVDHLTKQEIQAYKLADNKLAELSDWDEIALRDTVLELIEGDFDLQAVGLTDTDVDLILSPLEDVEPGEAPLSFPTKLRIEVGDIFNVGDHRIMCGDALNAEQCEALMEADQAAMAFLDFPYNVDVAGHVSTKDSYREFAMASGEMSNREFEDFLTTGLERAATHCRPGALLYPCMDWRGIGWLLHAAGRAELDYINLCVWAKNRAGMGSFYRSQHELIAVLRKPGAKHQNNVELGKNGRHRSNVWQYDTPVGSTDESDEAVADHPTPKNWRMVSDAIKDSTRRNDVVLDFYGGSGATLIAAGKTRRKARIMDIDPAYVGAMLLRYERAFGCAAVHAQTGLSLSELDLQRRGALTNHG